MTTPTGLAAAWERWVGVLRAHGCAVDAGLRPPVTVADLDAAQRTTRWAVPPAAVELVRLADGQVPVASAPPVATFVFPGHEFLPVSRSAAEWVASQGVPGLDGSWWPIAHDGGGNFLWLTAAGEVVHAGRDEAPRRVAPDLTSLLQRLAAAPLGPPEPGAWEDGFYYWESPGLD